MADCERLGSEIERLVVSIAASVPAESVAPAIRERELARARIEAQLRTAKPARPNIEKLRAALMQRAEQWKTELRAEPKVARLLLRRLAGPLELWDPVALAPEWVEWEASMTPELLAGRVHDGASPKGMAAYPLTGSVLLPAA